MLPVSTAYVADMAQLQRNRSFMMILLQIFNLQAEEDVVVSDNGAAVFASDAYVGDNHTDPVNYATLEPGRFVLDGTQQPLPDTAPYEYAGFVSDTLSDASGVWATPPVLTLQFTEDFGFSGLTFVFDSFLGEWVSSMQIAFYTLAGALVWQGTVAPNAASWVFNTKISGAAKIVITCLKSSKPYRRARIMSIRLGVEQSFDNTRIADSEMVHDVDPMARRLPTETFSLDILDYKQEYNPDNPNSFWEYIDAMTPMSVRYGYMLNSGTIEWLKPIWFHLDGAPAVSDWTVTFSATRQLGALTGTYRKGTFATKTLAQLAEDVLTDALGTPLPGETLWQLDEILSTISTNAPLPVLTHQECLQLIANAGMCALYTNADGVICLTSGWEPEGSAAGSMDYNTQLGRPVLEKTPPLYAEDVLLYQYQPDTTATELLNMSVAVNGTSNLQLDFSTAQNVQITVDGATVDSQIIYAAGADLVLSGTGTATITITGNPVRQSTSSAPLVVAPSITGETEVVENQLVTNEEHREALAKYRAEYMALRSAYTTDYRGDPAYECGDYLLLQTNFTVGSMALLLKNTITYNGALRGEAVLKRVTSLTQKYYTGEIYAGDTIGVM